MSGRHETEIHSRLALARSAAREAGQLTLELFRRGQVDVQRKADRSPVTVADQRAELLLRERIAEAFPDDGIVGEEFPEKPGTSGYRWIVDPIDGTKSFIFGVPLYGTLVGIEHQQASQAGVMYFPALDEELHAARGGGAWHVRAGRTERARVSACERLGDGLFLTSEVRSFAQRGAADVFEQLDRAAYVSRTWGDCYGYLLVATGRAEAMVDPELNVWDAAALQPIVQEAGGSFTDWRGEPTIYAGEGVGTNGRVLEEVLRITAPFAANR